MKRASLFVLFLIFASFAHAGIFKSSVGGHGNKFYTLNVNVTGTVQVSVLYDGAASNINLGLGSGSTLLCGSISVIKQTEKLECGVPAGSYSILVQNFSGPGTPFRLYISYGVNTIGSSKPVEMREIPSAKNLQGLADQLRDLASGK